MSDEFLALFGPDWKNNKNWKSNQFKQQLLQHNYLRRLLLLVLFVVFREIHKVLCHSWSLIMKHMLLHLPRIHLDNPEWWTSNQSWNVWIFDWNSSSWFLNSILCEFSNPYFSIFKTLFLNSAITKFQKRKCQG